MLRLATLCACLSLARCEQSVSDAIKGMLYRGEAGLQAGRWRQAAETFREALALLEAHALRINVAAEAQLHNNLGWATFHLGAHDEALTHYGASARACEAALPTSHEIKDRGFGECLEKVYDNIFELVYRTMHERDAAIEWMRNGVAAAARVAAAQPALDALVLGGTVLVRLGYLLVLSDDLDAAEATLAPLVDAALRDAVDDDYLASPRHAWPAKRRALLQEACVYLGWARAFRRDWPGASDAFDIAAGLGLPRDGRGCARGGRWRIQEGWAPPSGSRPTWRTYKATLEASRYAAARGAPAPWCVARGAGAVCAAPAAARDAATVVLVEIPAARLGGQDGAMLWQAAPDCVFFAGEHTASGSLPVDWGVTTVGGEELLVGDSNADVLRIESAILLLDAREGHKMFWHHQTETVARLLLVLDDVVTGDVFSGLLPRAQRRDVADRAVVLFPAALRPTVAALLAHGHAAAKTLQAQGRLRTYDWRPRRVYFFERAYVVDWAAPPVSSVPRAAGESCATGWLAAAARATAPPGLRRYAASVFGLHFVPGAVLRHQRAALRAALAANYTAAAPMLLYYSRADCDRRHVLSEAAVVDALRRRFGPALDVVVWAGGTAPDIQRAARDWSRAALVVGPHGAGLANFVHCAPGTPVVVFGARDRAGAPSASDAYFAHAAAALGLRLRTVSLAEPPHLFANYSSLSQRDIDLVVDTAFDALHGPIDAAKGS
ncbi:hypothetical protein M885DRAFT_541882 [Pelagophyceae sp. CCMP2097]|nr:hypothetical protein M885DRAFT_541882 [Pelagophyceae sp. CCMP2097]